MRQTWLPAVLAFSSAIIASACGRPLPPPASLPRARSESYRPTPPKPVLLTMEPLKLQAIKTPSGETRVEVLDAAGLFERGGELLGAGKYREATRAYEVILQSFPDSRYISPSLYNAGLAHERLKEFNEAAGRYRELIRRFGGSKEAIDAGFRLGGCFDELHNWSAAIDAFAELLRRHDLSANDRIEALARKGLAQFRLGDTRACKSSHQEAIELHQKIELTERLDSDFFVAMSYYYLAAIPHIDFRNVKVEAGGKLAGTLDEKARLLLLSQAGYIQTIKIKNPYWATAAGFQIGSLYREFYNVLLTTLPDFNHEAAKNARTARIPVAEAKTQLVQVYLEEVHQAVKPLLTKAIRVFEKNVLMAETVGVQSDWVVKSRTQIEELKHLLTLPPTEAVKLVDRNAPLPEDQPSRESSTEPSKEQPPKDPVDQAPSRPGDRPGMDKDADEPGKVVL